MATTATPTVAVTITDDATQMNARVQGTAAIAITASLGVELVTLPAATALLPLAFPVGIVTAKYIIVRALGATDVTIQVSLAGGSTVMAIPVNQAIALYNVTALYINSVLGGTIQYSIGG